MRTTITWLSMASTLCFRQIQLSPSPFKSGDTKVVTALNGGTEFNLPYLHTLKHRLLPQSKQECGNLAKVSNLVWHDDDILDQYLRCLSHLIFEFTRH
eukprot:2570602-Pleurochrysis_carterae.AAC.2